MEAIIFIGTQASGKSTFFRKRFFYSHVRVNLDMLKTRHREKLLVQACIAMKQPFVVDNTNPTPADRQRYIAPAREAGFRIIGYYFQSEIAECLRRNANRPGDQRIPEVGIHGTHSRLSLPALDEGFDELNYVRIDDRFSQGVEPSERGNRSADIDGFHIEPWTSG